MKTVKILALSDQAVERVYALAANGHFHNVDLLLGCGDLPYAYLEYLLTLLNKPLMYVPGNHDPQAGTSAASRAEGGLNLDGRVESCGGILLAGLGGSIRYRPDGVNQYSQNEAYLRAFRLLPGLLLNRLRYGRALDALVTHSPPFGIHDDDSQAHRGLRAINWLMQIAKPRYVLHGHTHFYRNNLENPKTFVGGAAVINIYPYQTLEISHV